MTQGFGNWTLSELQQFVDGVRRFMSDDLVNIAMCVPTKTLQEVTEYSKVFWKRYKEIDYKHVGNIERYKVQPVQPLQPLQPLMELTPDNETDNEIVDYFYDDQVFGDDGNYFNFYD